MPAESVKKACGSQLATQRQIKVLTDKSNFMDSARNHAHKICLKFLWKVKRMEDNQSREMMCLGKMPNRDKVRKNTDSGVIEQEFAGSLLSSSDRCKQANRISVECRDTDGGDDSVTHGWALIASARPH